jgi:LCP family protein required for cell wall assembly
MHRISATKRRRVIPPRRWPRRILVGANVVVAVCLLGAGGVFGYVHWRFGQIKTEHLTSLSAPVSGGKPFTLLVVGSDSRAALSGPGNDQYGSAASTPGQRSDTIILLRVVPKTRQLMMLSIPRDLWGNIPGQGQNRINSAFDTGANLLIQTIQTDLGVPINHYVEVNFDSFKDITDAVGGVKFYFPTPAKDGYSNLNIPAAGCYNLTGDQALAFVRSRHYEYYLDGYWQYEAESDLARIQRQQAFIKKMITKSESEFTNPIALNGIIGGVTKNLTVDDGFSSSLMLDLAKDFRHMNVAGIPNLTLPTYPFTTSGGAEVLGLQQPQAAQTIKAFNAFGTTSPAPSHPATPKKSTTPTSTTVPVSPSKVSIEVANGTGNAGQAGEMTQLLASFGYTASLSTNSATGTATTLVQYAPDAQAAAEQLAAKIPGGATAQASAALAPTQYSIQLITGSSYDGATSATAAASSSSTTVPGTNSGVYELPGSTGPPPASC